MKPSFLRSLSNTFYFHLLSNNPQRTTSWKAFLTMNRKNLYRYIRNPHLREQRKFSGREDRVYMCIVHLYNMRVNSATETGDLIGNWKGDVVQGPPEIMKLISAGESTCNQFVCLIAFFKTKNLRLTACVFIQQKKKLVTSNNFHIY